MAEIVFLSGVDDKLGYACRLLRKKYREGVRMAVYGPAPLLERLDRLLWEQEPTDFVPHLRLAPGSAVAPHLMRTPIWLLDAPRPDVACEQALNMGSEDPAIVQLHLRVADIVGLNQDDVQAGRRRWKAYTAGGHVVKHLPQDKPPH
ncbi:DNA polymerase III subunit chi [Ideonella margarita]|uniref:DNA polymerase III subunit chi n=1 Tax=Ideonella margarita TaxID=2984191 RepID=A0ABU9CDT4_9BURK